MRLRQIFLTLGLATAIGLAAGCSEDPTVGTGATGSPAAPSPSSAGGTDTAAVCDAVVAAYEKERAALVTALGEMLSANAAQDQAAVDAARAQGEAVVGRLVTAVQGELSGAADPQVKADVQAFVDTFEQAFTPEGLNDPALDAKVDAAAAAAAKHCPALNG